MPFLFNMSKEMVMMMILTYEVGSDKIRFPPEAETCDRGGPFSESSVGEKPLGACLHVKLVFPWRSVSVL